MKKSIFLNWLLILIMGGAVLAGSGVLRLAYANEEISIASNEYGEQQTFALTRSVDPTALVTKWNIPQDNTTIKLPALDHGLNINVDWGDGSPIENVTTYLMPHTYAKAGEYIITVTGTCPIWGKPNNTAPTVDDDYYTYTQYLTEVISWGEVGARRYSFSQCINLKSVASNYTENTFVNLEKLEDMFYNCISLESIDLSGAKTTNVTTMARMFEGAKNIKTINLNGLITSNVAYMNNAFKNCENLEELTINIDTSRVINISSMFLNCKNLESLDLSSFRTPNLKIMFDMFKGCSKLISLDLSTIDTSNVKNMGYIFSECTSLQNLNISTWNTGNATNMSNMFNGCGSLEKIDVSSFNTSNVTDMQYMFNNCVSLTSLEIINFNTSKVINMQSMFNGCKSLTSFDLSNFDTRLAKNLSYMFNNCSGLNSILLSNKFVIPSIYMSLFEGTINLSSIILTDATPVKDQFTKVKSQMKNKIFYVPTVSAEAEYEASWRVYYTPDVIRPILELIGDKEETLTERTPYEEKYYTVSGKDLPRSGDYSVYGYNVLMDGEVDFQTPGIYEINYTLLRYINGSALEIMFETRIINVEKVKINPPTRFKASKGAFENTIDISWREPIDTDLKYELWYRNGSSKWLLLTNNADNGYHHTELSKDTIYEYRIRSYNQSAFYSEYVYAIGSTIIEGESDNVVLDMTRPEFVHSYNVPDISYYRANTKLEVVFDAVDVNYYAPGTTLTAEDITVMIGDKQFIMTDTILEKTSTASGERYKFTINEVPYHTERGILKLVIAAGKIKDKAQNKNVETTIDTGVLIVNSTITKVAPTLKIDNTTNEITVTCNQQTSFMPDDITIVYEYRIQGNTEFIQTENNIINDIAEYTDYEVRTVLTDITGNTVASEISTIKTAYLPIKVEFSVVTPEKGNYSSGDSIQIKAQFNVNLSMVNTPVLTIKFGEGRNIALSGTFESDKRRITYNYMVKSDDLGWLTAIGFKGSVIYAGGTTKTYDIVPEISKSEIFVRTGATLNQAGEIEKCYPYIQDAIDAAHENTEASITVVRDEELSDTLVVENKKNIILNINGKSIEISNNDAIATALLNNGRLRIIEETGTGELVASGEEVKTIINNGTLDIVGGIIRANLANKTTGASAIYNSGTLTLGKNDGDIEIAIPFIYSEEYGVRTVETGIVYLNDGTIEGAKNKSYEGSTIVPTGNNLITVELEKNREKTFVGIDKVPPIITDTILTTGWQKEYVEVEIVITDNEYGTRMLTIDNEEIQLVDSKAVIRFTENKEYILYAEDNASNSSSKSLIINNIDKVSPEIINITASETENNGMLELIVEAQDLHSGLAGIILKEQDETPRDNEAWTKFETNPISKQYVKYEIEKNKIYYCFAKDAVGNIKKYAEKINFDFIDKNIPIIESLEVIKDEGKDYVTAKTVVVNVKARDNVAVEEILISNSDLTEDEARISNDWKKYNEKIIHELPADGDGMYTIYVWVKDSMGNISFRQTVSVKLKALVIGDNESDYTGNNTVYNKTKLRFLVKDHNFDFDNKITKDNIMLRLTLENKVIRNITTGLSVKKISDYDGKRVGDFDYEGETYELEMVNISGTGKLNLILLGGTYKDLARNEVTTEVRSTDIFVDNNAPKINVINKGKNDEGIEIREIQVNDDEGHRMDLIEVHQNGNIETYPIINGKIELPLENGAIVIAYDRAGNEGIHEVGITEKPSFAVDNHDVKLQYGGTNQIVNYTYEGNGALQVSSSDTNVANVALDINKKQLKISPVSAGNAEITLIAQKTDKYAEGKITITVEVTPLPVVLEWNDGTFDYNMKYQKISATVKNAISGDEISVTRYRNNNKVNAGKYTAEAIELSNKNYTVVGGSNITYNWQINKINRGLTLENTDLEIELPRTATITFSYTGEKADAKVVVSKENVISAQVNNYQNSGEIIVSSVGAGKSALTLIIPESTNYNKAEATIAEDSIEVIQKVWLVYDVQGGNELLGKWVIYGRPYGTLATPEKTGDKFAGWYTEVDGKGSLVTSETIVTAKDKHSIYACWNQAPIFTNLKVSAKTINSLTISVTAKDDDGDNLRYEIYLDGKLIHTSGYMPNNQAYQYTVKELAEYSPHSCYVIVDDCYERVQSKTIDDRTKCSGTGNICYAGVHCDGYNWATRTCTKCDVNGKITTRCSGGGTRDCTYYGCENGSVTGYCSGPSVVTCNTCNNTGLCPGPVEKVDTEWFTCEVCMGDTKKKNVYECATCGITGEGWSCVTAQEGCMESWSTNNHENAACPDCNGASAGAQTCAHGETSAHTYTANCGICGGDGIETYYCEHGLYSPHDITVNCTTCGGDKVEEYKEYPCDHGNNSAHYYCPTHEYNGSVSHHAYCSHGEVGEHN